jgi:hypothetical protein
MSRSVVISPPYGCPEDGLIILCKPTNMFPYFATKVLWLTKLLYAAIRLRTITRKVR